MRHLIASALLALSLISAAPAAQAAEPVYRVMTVCNGQGANCQERRTNILDSQGRVGDGIFTISSTDAPWQVRSPTPWRVCISLQALINGSVSSDRERCQLLPALTTRVLAYPKLTGQVSFRPISDAEAKAFIAYDEVGGAWKCADRRCAAERAAQPGDQIFKDKAASVCRANRAGAVIDYDRPEREEDSMYSLVVRCQTAG